MRHGLFGSLLVLLGSGVAALAQPAPEYRPAVGYYNPMAPAIYPPAAQIIFYLITRLSQSPTVMKAAMLVLEGMAVWGILQL